MPPHSHFQDEQLWFLPLFLSWCGWLPDSTILVPLFCADCRLSFPPVLAIVCPVQTTSGGLCSILSPFFLRNVPFLTRLSFPVSSHHPRYAPDQPFLRTHIPVQGLENFLPLWRIRNEFKSCHFHMLAPSPMI